MLNKLRDKKGARKKTKLLGRGIASGKGKTCGRGGKGQTARSGVSLLGFEGGQMPLYRRLPKRGFNNINRISYSPINIVDIERLIELKKLDPKSIKLDSLSKLNFTSKDTKIKLLAKGDIKTKFNIEVNAASKSALEKIEKIGGSVTVVNSDKGKKAKAV